MAGTLARESLASRHLHSDMVPDWDLLTDADCNVLFEGSRHATELLVALLLPCLTGPIAWRRASEPLKLAPACRTLIVEEVGTLCADEQATLRDWLEHRDERMQVVSTHEEALLPLVTHGLFDERLYYRLNVLLVHVGNGAVHPPAVPHATSSVR